MFIMFRWNAVHTYFQLTRFIEGTWYKVGDVSIPARVVIAFSKGDD